MNHAFTAFEIHNIIRNHRAIESPNHNICDTVFFKDTNKVKLKNMLVIKSFGYNLI